MTDSDTSRGEPVTDQGPIFPPGDFAIVELFGHTTLVGRISEVERFGAKMLALEPLFNDVLMDPVLHGGAAIYRLTPCSAEVAWKNQPRQAWDLPSTIRAVIPVAALPAPTAREAEFQYEDQPEEEDHVET